MKTNSNITVQNACTGICQITNGQSTFWSKFSFKTVLTIFVRSIFSPFSLIKIAGSKMSNRGCDYVLFWSRKKYNGVLSIWTKAWFFHQWCEKFRYTLKVFRYHNGHQYHQKHHAKALHCFLDVAMLLQRNFMVLIAVEAIKNDNRQAGLAWDKGKRGDCYIV